MSLPMRRNDRTVSGTYPLKCVIGGNFDSDVIASRAIGRSFAAPIAGMRLAKWLSGLAPKDRPGKIIQLRNYLAHAQSAPMVMNFDDLLAHCSTFPPTVPYSPPPGINSDPPASAQYVLLLLPKKYRDGLLRELNEEYRTIVLPQYGPAWARVYYWAQVLYSLLSIICRLLGRIAVGSS